MKMLEQRFLQKFVMECNVSDIIEFVTEEQEHSELDSNKW